MTGGGSVLVNSRGVSRKINVSNRVFHQCVPLNPSGMAFAWMGVGVINLSRSRTFRMRASRPKL